MIVENFLTTTCSERKTNLTLFIVTWSLRYVHQGKEALEALQPFAQKVVMISS